MSTICPKCNRPLCGQLETASSVKPCDCGQYTQIQTLELSQLRAELKTAQEAVDEVRERLAVQSLREIERALISHGYTLLAERIRYIANSQDAWLSAHPEGVK